MPSSNSQLDWEARTTCSPHQARRNPPLFARSIGDSVSTKHNRHPIEEVQPPVRSPTYATPLTLPDHPDDPISRPLEGPEIIDHSPDTAPPPQNAHTANTALSRETELPQRPPRPPKLPKCIETRPVTRHSVIKHSPGIPLVSLTDTVAIPDRPRSYTVAIPLRTCITTRTQQ